MAESTFDMEAFKKAYADAEDKAAVLTDDFWKTFAQEGEWSLWRCTYDYASDNEGLDPTKEIVSSFMKNADSVKGDIFAVMLVLEPSLEIEGLLLVKGGDPEILFGACEDSSWFTWNQLGPSITDAVKREVAALWNAKGSYSGKNVADTQTL